MNKNKQTIDANESRKHFAAFADWITTGGMEPIGDDLHDLICELVARGDTAEEIMDSGFSHPWSKIEEMIWVAGYKAGLEAGKNIQSQP